MLAFVLVAITVLFLVALTLWGNPEGRLVQAAPQQAKLSPRAKRRMASKGKPRHTRKNKKGVKVKG